MQKQEAEKILKKYNIKTGEIKKLARVSYINKSVIFLKNAGLYYEAVLLSSQVMEFTLKKLIIQCENIIEKAIDKKTVVRYEKNLKLENKTLGSLIYLIEKRIKNEKLIKDLKEFLKIRNKIAHNLITIEQDIKEIEKDSSEYVKSGKIFELMKDILSESNRVMFKQMKIDSDEKGEKLPSFLEDKIKEYSN
jgi:hypothetical protein